MARRTLSQRLLNTLQIKNDYSSEPAGLKWRSNTLFIVSVVGIALFTDLFLYGLVIPVLPFMLSDRVGVPKDAIQTYVSGLLAAYAGASVVFSPLAGIIADKVSTRQMPFLLGLAALMASTILLFLGRIVAILAVARILQGISAAFVWTIGLALCLQTVGPDNLGKTIGSIYSFIAVGNFTAPILGGVLYEKTGYAGVFAIGAAFIAVDFTMRIMVIEKITAINHEVDDPSTVSDLDVIRKGPGQTDESHNADPEPQQERSEDRTEDDPTTGEEYYKLAPPESRSALVRTVPIIPCLSDPMLCTALLGTFVQAALLGSFDATVPIVAGELFGFASLKSGLLFLPLGIFDFILSPVFGWCVDRYGTKPVAVLSYGFLVPILILLRVPREGGLREIAIYSVVLALCGVGLAGIGAPCIVEAGAIVQKYYEANPEFFGNKGPYAQLYGLSNMVFSLGLTVGPVLAGELKQAIGYGNMNLVLGAICLIVSALSFMFIGGKPRLLRRDRSNAVFHRRRA